MKVFSIALITGLIALNAAAQGSSNSSLGHYSTGVIPKSYGSCEALASQVSEAFLNAAEVELISTKCESNSHGSVVSLTYVEKSTPIQFSSTRGRSVTDDIAGRGYIATQQECEARKAVVIEQFKTATGLQPFFAYCMEDEAANYSTHPWHVAIEAVGIGAMTYQYIDRMVSEGLATDPAAFITEVKEYFHARPDTALVDAVYRMDNLSFARVGIALFAKKHVSVNKYEFLALERQKDCEFEARELKAAAIRSGMPVIGHGCQYRVSDFYRTFLIVETRAKLSYDSTGLSFESMDACRAARSKVFEDMKRAIGDRVVGISCSDLSYGPTAYVILKPAN